MEHKLPELPYAKKALEPHISAESLEYHQGKHHVTYVSNLNNLIRQKAVPFGSDWVLLVKNKNGSVDIKVSNKADTFITSGQEALFN